MFKKILTLAGVLFALEGAAYAQSYPHQTIRIVVPFAPGGTSEIVARSVAAELTTLLGVNVIVDNRAGGAGTIAMTEVAKAAPDGYTLILGHVGTLAVNPYAMERQPYDVNKDFVPIALLAKVPNIFVVNTDVVTLRRVPVGDRRSNRRRPRSRPTVEPGCRRCRGTCARQPAMSCAS